MSKKTCPPEPVNDFKHYYIKTLDDIRLAIQEIEQFNGIVVDMSIHIEPTVDADSWPVVRAELESCISKHLAQATFGDFIERQLSAICKKAIKDCNLKSFVLTEISDLREGVNKSFEVSRRAISIIKVDFKHSRLAREKAYHQEMFEYLDWLEKNQ